MREEVFERLNEIFREIFDQENLAVYDETTADEIEGWDSLEHINLITEIENVFNIKFSIKEAAGMKNVGEMADLILKHLR